MRLSSRSKDPAPKILHLDIRANLSANQSPQKILAKTGLNLRQKRWRQKIRNHSSFHKPQFRNSIRERRSVRNTQISLSGFNSNQAVKFSTQHSYLNITGRFDMQSRVEESYLLAPKRKIKQRSNY